MTNGETMREAATAALHALRSYQYGNASTELAEEAAGHLEAALAAPVQAEAALSDAPPAAPREPRSLAKAVYEEVFRKFPTMKPAPKVEADILSRLTFLLAAPTFDEGMTERIMQAIRPHLGTCCSLTSRREGRLLTKQECWEAWSASKIKGPVALTDWQMVADKLNGRARREPGEGRLREAIEIVENEPLGYLTERDHEVLENFADRIVAKLQARAALAGPAHTPSGGQHDS